MDIHSLENGVSSKLVKDLENTLHESLHIQDTGSIEHTYDENDNNDTKFTMKCLSRCATFPNPNLVLYPSSSDEEAVTPLLEPFSENSTRQTYSRSVSLPTPLKPVSAMKVSREKQGASREKLTVKWAPDVYDPAPTSSSHTVKSKKQQKSKNNKKNEKKNDKKNGKKGKKANSRGSSGKEKKQSRKIGDDLDVGSRDCGSSYLKKSVTSVHYPVAEAS
ncbi:BRI1-KD interacting protein [Quillaja saponaria]|uniref:BRI1-KD interacting protein n=1 Tax=Quillaja saponaria TaxID=32244 RepID=A0AAD7VEF2_QUISA|nr:BRI1-KD interacting protein [Quillaja saponaria]